METKRVNIVVEARDWEKFQSLRDPTGKTNASHHIREAMRLYLRVLETEDEKIFEEKLKSGVRREDTCKNSSTR